MDRDDAYRDAIIRGDARQTSRRCVIPPEPKPGSMKKMRRDHERDKALIAQGAEAEREECARIAEMFGGSTDDGGELHAAETIAAAIRERGKR